VHSRHAVKNTVGARSTDEGGKRDTGKSTGGCGDHLMKGESETQVRAQAGVEIT